MDYRNSFDGIDDYAANLIKHKARQLVGKAGLTRHDRPDIEQALMLDLLHRMKHFNPAKGKKTTFMARIVERHISTILEARFAKCRDWRKCHSLNEPVGISDGNQAEKIELLSSDKDFKNPCDMELSSLKMDVERVLDTLPDDLKELCGKLQDNNMADIAREMGVPRSTLYGKLTKLREIFREAGLEEYL